MIVYFFRMSIFVMLAALSSQVLAFSDSEKSGTQISDNCAMMSSPKPGSDALQAPHHVSEEPVRSHHTMAADAEHSDCCEQDCTCPANLCGHAFFVEVTTQQVFTPDTRKHIARLLLMHPSVAAGALFRPPIIA